MLQDGRRLRSGLRTGRSLHRGDDGRFGCLAPAALRGRRDFGLVELHLVLEQFDRREEFGSLFGARLGRILVVRAEDRSLKPLVKLDRLVEPRDAWAILPFVRFAVCAIELPGLDPSRPDVPSAGDELSPRRPPPAPAEATPAIETGDRRTRVTERIATPTT
jgi:hypothetical protein